MSTGRNYGSVIGCENNYGTVIIIVLIIEDQHQWDTRETREFASIWI